MKTILWLCNSILPPIAREMGLQKKMYSCGWLWEMFDRLTEDDNGYRVSVMFPYSHFVKGHAENFDYFGFVEQKASVGYFEAMLDEVSPSLIHICGTEFKHTSCMMEAITNKDMKDKAVVAIQGLVSVYSSHYYAYLPNKVVCSWTIRDIIRLDNIKRQQKTFSERGKYEIASIKKAKHIMGRTEWDFACCQSINSDIKYHNCNETLRALFYENAGKWSVDNCEKHSIFICQSYYPIKGMHLFLESFSEIIRDYPDAHLYTIGKNPLELSLKERLKLGSYGKYLGQIIKKNHLEEHITFSSSLDEKEMVQRYLSANVFISCSSIENSCNSLGEAMMLGVPCIASDVGGTRSVFKDKVDGFIYPADEPYMLPFYIRKIFNDKELCNRFSYNAMTHAKRTHSIEDNMNQLYSIYKELTDSTAYRTV